MNAARREEIRRMIALYKDPKLEGEVPGTLAILDALEECFEELWVLENRAEPCEEGCDDVSHGHCVPICRSSKQCEACEKARDRWYNR